MDPNREGTVGENVAHWQKGHPLSTKPSEI